MQSGSAEGAGTLSEFPWIKSRLEHLRLLEIRDTAKAPIAQSHDAEHLARLNVGALLVVGFNIRGRLRGVLGVVSATPSPDWGADLHLALKLVSVSVASGLERIELLEDLFTVQERDRLVTQTANDGLWDYDVRDNSMYFSPRWRAMLGYADGVEVPEWRLLVHPDDFAHVQNQLREHLEGRTELFESVHRMQHASGEWRWIQSRVQGRLDENRRLRRLVGVETDITERKLYEEALFREKESAQITLQSIGDGVVTTDAEARVQYLNPVASELTGWKLDDAVGRSIDEIFRGFHEETCEPIENPVAIAMRRNRPIKSVRPALLIRRDGNELYIESTASPIRDPVGSVTGGVLVFHDVSESRELNRRLSYAASHDILTELVNRREFETRLERALKSAKARETSYAVLYLDLDQFKIVNDACGHNAGDALLKQIGALLKSKIRWRDTLARLGGDEFGVLLESCTMDEALRTAENLRELISEFRFVWDERTFRLGVSVGVVPITPQTDDVASLLSAADSACAAAKDAGRNRVYNYQENDIDLMKRRKEMQWAARISNALDENRFELFRQTIQPLQATGEHGAHYELLIRMRDETGSLIAPGTFHRGRRALRPHDRDRSLGDPVGVPLARVGGRRARAAHALLDQPVGSELGRREVPAVRDRAVPEERPLRRVHLLRDHGDCGDRELQPGEPLHPRAQGDRLPFRARRLRHRPLVVRLPEAFPGRLPEDRRQLREGDAARSDRSRDGALDQRDRAPHRQEDDRRVRRERGDHHDAARHGHRLRAGLRRRRAEAADPGRRVAARRRSKVSSDSCAELRPVAAR